MGSVTGYDIDLFLTAGNTTHQLINNPGLTTPQLLVDTGAANTPGAFDLYEFSWTEFSDLQWDLGGGNQMALSGLYFSVKTWPRHDVNGNAIDDATEDLDSNSGSAVFHFAGLPTQQQWDDYHYVDKTMTAFSTNTGINPSFFVNLSAEPTEISGGTGTSNPVPEPATWAMMLAGFALAGLRLKKARRSRV